MLRSHQERWGIPQWVAYLREVDIPVMARSRAAILEAAELEAETLSPGRLAEIVMGDPFLTLHLLRLAERRRSRQLGRETTTALAAVMQIGLSELIESVREHPVCDDSIAGLVECEARAALAGRIGRAWGSFRVDVSPEEIALAALLSELGELMLWAFVPELPQRALDELLSGRAPRSQQAQQQAVGFSFKSLSLSLAEAWELPALVQQLIRGADNHRANIARIATNTARHLAADAENPALPDDIVEVRAHLPGVSYAQLLLPLPISDEYRDAVLLYLSGAAPEAPESATG